MKNNVHKLITANKVFLLLAVFLLTTNCAGLLGSLSMNGATAVATGHIEKSVAKMSIDVVVHNRSGKTPGGHLYAMLETDRTKKHLEKHFPDKEVTRQAIWKLAYDEVVDFEVVP